MDKKEILEIILGDSATVCRDGYLMGRPKVDPEKLAKLLAELWNK